MIEIILLSSGAGIIGTGLGGLIGLLFGESSKKTMSYLLSFASGVMVSIVCFDLIPEGLELGGMPITIVGILLGILVVQGLNYVIDKISNERETHTEFEELRHQEDLLNPSGSRSLLTSGLIMFAAIALHNLPEGISICVPLIAGGMNRWKAILLTTVSGAPTLIGGLAGYMLGSISDKFIAISLALAAGAMLYVTYCEILPQVILMNKKRQPAVFTIIGIIFGLVVVNLLA